MIIPDKEVLLSYIRTHFVFCSHLLPRKMREGPVRFRHPMHILLLLMAAPSFYKPQAVLRLIFSHRRLLDLAASIIQRQTNMNLRPGVPRGT